MPERLPGDPHYTGIGPDGREWICGIPLATDEEVMRAKATQARIEAHVRAKMRKDLEWREKFGIVLEHPDDGWVYRPWAAQPQYTYDGKKYGMKSGNGPTCYWPQYEQYGLITPSYPTLFSPTLGYGDRICLGHWGEERFMKIVAVIDRPHSDSKVVSCKENPARWKVPKVNPLHPSIHAMYAIVFEPDPEHPFYYKEITDDCGDLEKDTGGRFKETTHPTDKPYPRPKPKVRDTDPPPPGCGCFVMIVLILLLMGLIAAIFK